MDRGTGGREGNTGGVADSYATASIVWLAVTKDAKVDAGISGDGDGSDYGGGQDGQEQKDKGYKE